MQRTVPPFIARMRALIFRSTPPLSRSFQQKPGRFTPPHRRQATVAMDLSFLSAEEVKAILHGPSEELEKTAIIDVRDEDFAGGHVKGATNIPSELFRDDQHVDDTLQRLAAAGKERIVVHCALSQQRGPAAARRIQQRLDAAGSGAKQPQVQVMEKGFRRFSQLYGGDSSLVERD